MAGRKLIRILCIVPTSCRFDDGIVLVVCRGVCRAEWVGWVRGLLLLDESKVFLTPNELPFVVESGKRIPSVFSLSLAELQFNLRVRL
jgi:hypothetical protein